MLYISYWKQINCIMNLFTRCQTFFFVVFQLSLTILLYTTIFLTHISLTSPAITNLDTVSYEIAGSSLPYLVDASILLTSSLLIFRATNPRNLNFFQNILEFVFPHLALITAFHRTWWFWWLVLKEEDIIHQSNVHESSYLDSPWLVSLHNIYISCIPHHSKSH